MWKDTELRAKKPRDKAYRITENTEVRGSGRMIFEVKPNGKKFFYFQYFRKQPGTKSKRILVLIGPYKQTEKTPGITLVDARAKTLKLSELLRDGVDVKYHLELESLQETTKVREASEAKKHGTFRQLMETYVRSMEASGKRSFKSVESSLNTYVSKPFPEMVNRKANEITTDDIRIIIMRMMKKGITTQCNRVRSHLNTAFVHGLKQDNDPRNYLKEEIKFNLESNPVTNIPIQKDFERVGEHVISEKEICTIWHELPKINIVMSITSSLVKMALVTGQRVGELSKLKWSNVDIEENTILIPASVSKNKKDHIFPLCELSLNVIEELRSLPGGHEYVFPSVNGYQYSIDRHTDPSTYGRELCKFCKNNDDVNKFVARDIRRTWKTLAGKAGLDKSIRDRIQNHSLQDVSSKHYDRYDYLREKRQAMKVWNDYLYLVINPHKKVSHISQRSA